MKHALAFTAGLALAAASVSPAAALPSANGSFGIAAFDRLALNTPDIEAGTSAATWPADARVNIIGSPGNLGLTAGEAVELTPLTLAIPPGGTSAPTHFSVRVGDLRFDFSTITTRTLTPSGKGSAGFINLEFEGDLADGGGRLAPGSFARLSEGYVQSEAGADLNASASNLTASPTPILEPSTLALLLGALAAFGILGRAKLV